MFKHLNGHLVEMTAEEIAALSENIFVIDPWIEIRAKRNKLLIESDWSQLPDAPCNQESWAAYRQALRDLPSTYPDPTTLVWPSTPTDTGKAE